MRVLIFGLFLCAVSGAAVVSISHDDQLLMEQFEQFKRTHGKQYKNEDEEKIRFAVYVSNKHMIDQHNEEHRQGKHNFTMKMNHFGDMMHEEFVATMNGFKRELRETRRGPTFIRPDKSIGIPDSIDWRTKGAVTPVKNQGQCGSCWAFSATGALEGQQFRQTGQLVSLSEQNLIDCSFDVGNNGCLGGVTDLAFKYVKVNYGIDTEASYPYDQSEDECTFKRENVGAVDYGYVDIEWCNEEALTEAIAMIGPISVAIDASKKSFMFYHSGVYSDPKCYFDLVDHAVLAVGYGSEKNEQGHQQDYYIVKNSWTEKWGENGYIKMARNMRNMCGIASYASYPLM